MKKVSREEIWNQLDADTQGFVRALTKSLPGKESGIKIKAIKNKDNFWSK